MSKKYVSLVPDKYMDGWDNVYKKQMEGKLDELPQQYVHYALQEYYLFTQGKDHEGKKALEFGTGDGRYACFLAQLGFEVDAVDILPSAIEITEKRAEALGVTDKMNILLTDMDTFELQPESYDVISAIQCLQYLYEGALPKLLELIEAVKPGGFLLYGGNVKPHFKTDPPLRFITTTELKTALKGWELYSIAKEVRLVRPKDRRGYIWTVSNC
ncbi:MAG: class I SAM-dependent methyltransferase [Candidatus Heimdallarchaeota archaeon]|nr:class I SAM-dependent methyltransferase [Candidatus Heimdallarchaeota archaeon]